MMRKETIQLQLVLREVIKQGIIALVARKRVINLLPFKKILKFKNPRN